MTHFARADLDLEKFCHVMPTVVNCGHYSLLMVELFWPYQQQLTVTAMHSYAHMFKQLTVVGMCWQHLVTTVDVVKNNSRWQPSPV